MIPRSIETANLSDRSGRLGLIGFEIDEFLEAEQPVAPRNHTVLRWPVSVPTAHSSLWANRGELTWIAEADHLPHLVSFLESLTLENCATLGAVILVYGQFSPSSPAPALSAFSHTFLYHLAPSVPQDPSFVGLGKPVPWHLARVSRETWVDSLGLCSMHQPAIIFSEAPLIQAIM